MKNFLQICALAVLLAGVQSCQHHPVVIPIDNGGLTDSSTCDPDSVYFNRDIMPIIQTNCAVSGCHGGGSAEDGVDLTSYASIISTADVEPFNPGGSELFEVLNETDPDKIMPQPPYGPLTAEQIALIEKWINQGAQNNSCFDCDESIFTFSGAISKIIADNCVGCHSYPDPQGGVSLESYSQIEASALSGALFGVINHEDGYVPMPYGLPKLSDCQINQVRQWIDDGAMDN